ncbi:crossover junction endodeoxyribonuclease RuvC [Cohnella terricola]|uniref:Crossover junction endodeoxyribonuclease RuvC n=1 Tax=Cohnella terricola TaxID=1289167 RepID=A0A559JDK5_9BACL|nr:crossover junction endodeoxyribonuclease RuvC [Cohnella terricola]TVX97953.1 crossover junction endodeoxyribonuclease RuvC [Cohnella terricola]
MNVLFCDQSLLKFGYSIYDASALQCTLITAGVLQLDDKSAVMNRLFVIENWLNDIIAKYNIQHVVVEEIQMQRNVRTYRKLCMLFYVLESVCWRKGISFESIHVTTWRTHGIKTMLNLPDGKKMTLYNYFYTQFKHDQSFDHNVSDALGLGLYWSRITYPNADIGWDNNKA